MIKLAIKAVIICRTCEDIIKQELGIPGFESLESEYDSLTDAWKHLFDNRSHQLEIEIRND